MVDINLSATMRANLLAQQSTLALDDRTGYRLATGLKVNSPVEDAVAYFSAKALTDRAETFDDRKQGIDQAISALNVAVQATGSVEAILKQMKGLLQAGASNSGNGSQLSQLSTQFLTLATQLNLVVHDAMYVGIALVGNTSVNASGSSSVSLSANFSDLSQSKIDIYASFLGAYTDSVNNLGASAGGAGTQSIFSVFGGTVGLNSAGGAVVSALAANGIIASGALNNTNFLAYLLLNGVSVGTDIGLGSAGLVNFSNGGAGVLASIAGTSGFLGIGMSNYTAAGFAAGINSIDLAISKSRAAAAVYGSTIALLATRLDFTKQYVDTLQGGGSKYTLTDVGLEGANLQVLETRELLGSRSMAFASSTDQLVLSLFR